MWLYRSHLYLAALLLFIILRQQMILAQGEPCWTAEFSGTCTSLWSCPHYVILIKTHRRKIGDFLRSVLCYNRDNDPHFCCPPSHDKTLVIQPRPGKTPSRSCGFSNAHHNRVVGGVVSAVGAWPWITALGYRNKHNPRRPLWLCGGSLISAQHVLTASHCVFKRTDLYLARLGEHDILSDDDDANPIDVPIVLGIVHPGYNEINYVNDIALLKLKYPVTFSDNIHPVCLPTLDSRFADYTGKYPFTAGWGSISFAGPPSPVLQEVQVPLVSLDECRSTYRSLTDTRVIDERVLCAGLKNGGKDACQGDSGGPLMVPDDTNTFVLIGIVSFGHGCGEPDIPGVYTKVSYYLDFIYEYSQE